MPGEEIQASLTHYIFIIILIPLIYFFFYTLLMALSLFMEGGVEIAVLLLKSMYVTLPDGLFGSGLHVCQTFLCKLHFNQC